MKNHVDEMLRRSRAVRDDVRALGDELKALAMDVSRRLDLHGRLERHPYRTLLAVAGVGYVLGGGLMTRATARLVTTGARLMLVPLLRAELGALAASLLGGEEEPAPEGGVKYHA